MRKITILEPVDFLNYCLNFAEEEQAERVENYTHTHNRVHYDPDTGILSAEAVNKNENGQCFGIGRYYTVQIPLEWAQFLPSTLTNAPFWGDFE